MLSATILYGIFRVNYFDTCILLHLFEPCHKKKCLWGTCEEPRPISFHIHPVQSGPFLLVNIVFSVKWFYNCTFRALDKLHGFAGRSGLCNQHVPQNTFSLGTAYFCYVSLMLLFYLNCISAQSVYTCSISHSAFILNFSSFNHVVILTFWSIITATVDDSLTFLADNSHEMSSYFLWKKIKMTSAVTVIGILRVKFGMFSCIRFWYLYFSLFIQLKSWKPG